MSVECESVEGEQVKIDVPRGGYKTRWAPWCDEGDDGHVITVDYRESVLKGGTWPGGRATLQGNTPRGVRARKRSDDARYIYVSYTLLAELHLFEQVNDSVIGRSLGKWNVFSGSN